MEVTIEFDASPRHVNVPADVKLALEQANARVAFERLSYSGQKEYVEWIEEAKKPQTRKARIGKATERIVRGAHLR